MPGYTHSQDIADVVADVTRRLHSVEMRLSSADTFYTPNPSFEDVTIGDGEDAVVLDTTVNPPTGVTATPGIYENEIFVDVEWVPPDAGASSFQADLALVDQNSNLMLVDTARVIGSTIRFSGLRPNTNYAVRVEGVNAIGIQTSGSVWVEFVTGQDTTIPPAVSNVILARGATSLIVKWNPLSEAEAPDVANGEGMYRVEVDTVETFDSVNLHHSVDTGYVRAFNDISTPDSWRARVAAVDSSGNQGPWTLAEPIIAGGVNDSMIVADLSAAKITFGEMHGDRIQANTIDANKLTTSSLVSADITLAGGSFRAGSPPNTGLLVNSQGIRLYAAGAASVILDAATGSASFIGNINGSSITGGTMQGTNITGATITGGTIRTAYSGKRVVITNTGFVEFYDSSGGLVGSLNADNATGRISTMGGHIEAGAFYAGSGYYFDGSLYAFSAQVVNNLSVGSISVGGYSVIHSGNIGSQSVNYANSAGSAGTATSVSGGAVIGGSGYNHSLASPSNRSGGFFSYCLNYLYMTSGGGSEVRWDSGNGRLFYASSTDKIKKDIHDFSGSKIMQMRPRSWTPDIPEPELSSHDRIKIERDIKFIGFVAEELHAIDPTLVTFDGEGDPNGIEWPAITTMLVEEVQNLSNRLVALEKKKIA